MAARRKANETKGVPIPGTGVTHGHHKRGRRNPAGATMHVNQEWGATGRKHEDADRNLNNRARRDAIDEGLDEIFATQVDDEPLIDDGDWDDYWVDEAWDDLYAGTADEY